MRLCGIAAPRASLSRGSTPAGPQLLTSVFIHSDHVFLGLCCFLVPGIGEFVTYLIQNAARCLSRACSPKPESCAGEWSAHGGVWRWSWCASGLCPLLFVLTEYLSLITR